jgi:hypothetical protein
MVSPKIPYGGFSPVRLKGWNIRRGLPRSRVCLRPSCRLPPSRFPAQCQGRWVSATPPCERFSALPQGPSLRSGLCCPGPSSLNWPHAPHSQAHPDFAAGWFIRDIFAVPDLHRPRRPTSGSELSSMLFRNMSSSTTTGNSSAACTQYFAEDPSLQLRMTVSAFPSPSHSDPRKGVSFRGLTTVRLRYDLLFCLPSLSEQTRFASSHREGVYFRASDGLVTRPAAGYHYGANWAICAGGSCTR